jgi:thiol-disulfide isomerase/thioredoxin
MDRVKKLLGNLAQPRLLMTLFVVAIFIACAVFAYNKFIKPQMNPKFVPNKEFNDSDTGEKDAVIYYFTAEWCPVSKRVFPQWEKFVSEYEGKLINGYTLRTRVVDCEKEQEMADKAKIEGYPTVKLMYDNQVVEYDANVKYDTLVEFVNSSLQG